MAAHAEIIPYVFYEDVPAAIEWLTGCLGFAEELRHPTPSGGLHAELSLQGRRVMLGGKPGMKVAGLAPTQGVFIYVDDVASMHARCVAFGATVDGPPTDHGYGLTVTASDPEGHPWYLTQRA